MDRFKTSRRVMSEGHPSIGKRVGEIRRRIEAAALRSGRDPGDVRLVAVTKTVGVEGIRKAIDAGVTAFGENYVQEAKEKIEALEGGDVEWHFIGHLQRNKARDAVRLFEMIHSIDSLRIAEEVDKRARQIGKTMKVLIQVNLSGEESKSGISKDGVEDLIHGIQGMENLSLLGLMTLPPYMEDPEEVRPYFRALRSLRDEMEGKTGMRLPELSMGMSHDFEVAIEEGATLVRIGSAIFGPR